jgi:hypothetical protein
MGVGDSCRLAAVNFGFELRAACELELHTALAHRFGYCSLNKKIYELP